MVYIYEYELCALVFLLIITVRFFAKRHFPDMENNLFGVIIICGILDIALDVVSAFTIKYASSLPIWLNMLVNTWFYALGIFLSALVMIYIFIIAKIKNRAFVGLLIFPAVFFGLILILIPKTELFFFFDENFVYTHGPLFPYLYGATLLCFIACAVFVSIFRKRIRRNQFNTIIIFVLIIGIAMGIQYFFPQYLLSGVAIALAISLMYFTLQNPEEMLDSLTGAFNYGAMLVFLRDRIEEKRKISIVAIDVGSLRRINSIFGLDIGDDIMRDIGRFLTGIRDNTWVFRMIGTRFVIVSYDDEHNRSVLAAVENRFCRLWKTWSDSIMLNTIICYFNEIGGFSKPEEIITLIDSAFLEADERRSESVVEIDNRFLDKIRRRIKVEAALRRALENEGQGFELYFQPIYSIKEKCFNTVEVLLRFCDDELGIISPEEFIPIAERTGLIIQVDEWVLEKSFSFIGRVCLDRLGLVNVEVNLSAAEFMHEYFAEKLNAATNRNCADPKYLIFEITETAATASYEILAHCMNEMCKRGFRFALDDFGTGFANLSQVVDLPFSMVKLDRSMLVPKLMNENSSIVFEDTIAMFSRLGMSVVVEGVEEEEQVARIEKLGADYIQGYFYSNPMPENELIEFLSEKNRLSEKTIEM